MELVSPGLGLIFWMTLSFSLLVFILRKFAWKPIINMIYEREQTIEDALNQANLARQEMKNLQANNELLIIEAKEQRDAIMVEARKIREKMIEEARVKANEEAQRIIETAKESIHFEKMKAITDLKNQVAHLSIDIAEKLLREELSNKQQQKTLIDKMMSEVNFN